MDFNEKYKQRIQELEYELNELKLVLLEKDRRLIYDKFIIDGLHKEILILQKQIEEEENKN